MKCIGIALAASPCHVDSCLGAAPVDKPGATGAGASAANGLTLSWVATVIGVVTVVAQCGGLTVVVGVANISAADTGVILSDFLPEPTGWNSWFATALLSIANDSSASHSPLPYGCVDTASLLNSSSIVPASSSRS